MIKKIRVGLVDDDSSKLMTIERMFHEFSQDNQFNAELIPIIIDIEKDIEKTFEQFHQKEIHCAIIDYKLVIQRNVSYNGIELAEKLINEYSNMPIFILTGFESDVYLHEDYDVLGVFDFGRYQNEEKEAEEVHTKIVLKVRKAEKDFNSWSEEIRELIPHLGQSDEVDSRILELDGLIESSLSKSNSLSLIAKKKLMSGNSFEELLNKINDLLED